MIFKPFLGGTFWGEDNVCALEPDVPYRPYYFNPFDGGWRDLGMVKPSQGCWRAPRVNAFQDWVLVLEAVTQFR